MLKIHPSAEKKDKIQIHLFQHLPLPIFISCNTQLPKLQNVFVRASSSNTNSFVSILCQKHRSVCSSQIWGNLDMLSQQLCPEFSALCHYKGNSNCWNKTRIEVTSNIIIIIINHEMAVRSIKSRLNEYIFVVASSTCCFVNYDCQINPQGWYFPWFSLRDISDFLPSLEYMYIKDTKGETLLGRINGFHFVRQIWDASEAFK